MLTALIMFVVRHLLVSPSKQKANSLAMAHYSLFDFLGVIVFHLPKTNTKRAKIMQLVYFAEPNTISAD